MNDRNPWICVAIVVSLAIVAVIGTTGLVLLEYAGRVPGQALVAVVSSAVGAIAGALAVSPHVTVRPVKREGTSNVQ